MSHDSASGCPGVSARKTLALATRQSENGGVRWSRPRHFFPDGEPGRQADPGRPLAKTWRDVADWTARPRPAFRDGALLPKPRKKGPFRVAPVSLGRGAVLQTATSAVTEQPLRTQKAFRVAM